jgi:hypothetical protein
LKQFVQRPSELLEHGYDTGWKGWK